MALIDMQRTAAEKKAQKASYEKMDGMGSGEDYPYGLGVSLDHESLNKLGMTGKLPKVGSKIPLTAHAHVKSTSEETRNGRTTRRMELELRHMSLDHGEAEAGGMEPDGDTMGAGMKGAMDGALKAKGSEDAKKKARK